MRSPSTIIAATRPQFFPAIAIPITCGTVVAWWEEGQFDTSRYLLSLLAGLALHGGMNMINDYFDHLRGTDDINTSPLTPYAGGSRVIQEGAMTAMEVYRFGRWLLLTGSIIGLYLALDGRPWIMAIGLFGLLSGFFYSAPPLFLSGRGLGELTVALNFGPLSTAGAYYIQSGGITMDVLMVSIPMSLLVVAILFISEFPDYHADKRTGKFTLVVRLGRERARAGLYLLILLALAAIPMGIITGAMPPVAITTALPILYGLKGARGLWRHCNDGPELLPYIRATIHTYTASGVVLILSFLISGTKGVEGW